MERKKLYAPNPSRTSEFATEGTERKFLIPECACRSEQYNREFIVRTATRKWRRLPNYVLDVRGKNSSLHVRAASGQQHIVRVPIDGKDGGLDGFLEKIRDPLIALVVEKADRDSSDNNRSRLEKRMAA